MKGHIYTVIPIISAFVIRDSAAYNRYNSQSSYQSQRVGNKGYGGGQTGLFSVIEDSFYKPRSGYPRPDDEYQQPPDIFSSRSGSLPLDHHDYQSLRTKKPKRSHVSVASSLGRVRGPEYPYKTRPPPPETTTRSYSRRTTRTSYDSSRNEIEQTSEKKYFKAKKSSYYDPFSFQSTERSPTVEKYLKYKKSQQNKNIYSNRLDSRFSIQESNYVSSSKAKNRPRSTQRPVVISYEEALAARTRPAPRPSLSTTSSGLEASDSTQPVYRRRPHPQERPESRYGSYGYQGAINPVFVSLNAEENVAIRSRIPTPAPRNYFPVSGDDEYQDVTEYNSDIDDFYTSNRIDEIDSSSGITTFSYNDDNRFGGVTVATGGYGGYYDAHVTSPPPPPSVWTTERPEADLTTASYYDEDDIWAGYSKVVQDLLRDRQYPRPQVVTTDYDGHTSGYDGHNSGYDGHNSGYDGHTNGYDGHTSGGNKFVGSPQSVSTRPLIVSPNMDSSDLGDPGRPRNQPRDDLLTSYSDRYGWGQSQAFRDSLREFNRNWTSIELAKPVWEDEPKLRQGEDDLSLSEYSGGRRGQSDGQGSVEPVNMDLVDTYGYWDQSLDIMPALSRSTDPRPKRWILLSKTQEEVDMGTRGEEGEAVSTAALGVSVDGSRYVE